MPRKRPRDEMDTPEQGDKRSEPSLLQRLRNMWEFASVMQFIFVFGKAVKINEDFDIEDFENECLKPGHSEKLEEIGLTLLKWISSHRGLNYDIWDEYTRRQYLAKAPPHLNPYGEDEEPNRFRNFDIFTKVRVLHRLTVWTFWNPDRMREKMADHPREADQIEWRIEEFGYDRDERQYYLLDDNRFYRRTEPPLPAAPKAKPKSNSKKAIAARRRESKRRKLDVDADDAEEENEEQKDDTEMSIEEKKLESWEVDTLGGFKWECLCINLPDYQQFCESLKKTKDPNEKALRDRLMEEVVPIIEAAEERRRRKIERRERELMVMEKMVGAKRSSRLADKQDRERREIEQVEAEKKRRTDLAAAHREQVNQDKMEQDRQYRMMTREQRIKDREYKRLLKEEEVARDELEQKRIDEGESRASDRALKQRMERNKKELEDLEAEEDWTFDCSVCGVHGKNLDDGTPIIQCERCNVWQHSKCLGIAKSAAEKSDFHFVCKDCRRKEEDAKKPKISLKFRVGASSSPVPPSPAPRKSSFAGVEIPRQQVARPSSQGSSSANGYPSSPSLSAQRPQQLQNGLTPQQLQASPQRAPNQPAFGNRPIASGYQSIQPYPSASNNLQARTLPPATPNSPPYHNGVSHQHQSHTSGQRPLAPSPLLNQQAPMPNAIPNSGRLPSPVFNRPTMSPTQGNMDVGPLVGLPERPSPSPQRSLNGSQPFSGGMPSNVQATPRPDTQRQSAHIHQTPISRTPNYPLSGLSPKKQQTPAPLPKSTSMSPPLPSASIAPTKGSSILHATPGSHLRTVSGTPILPPVETLRPSPQQLRNSSSTGPVPTPSKQEQPQSHIPPPQFGMEAAASAKEANIRAAAANSNLTAEGQSHANVAESVMTTGSSPQAENMSHPQARDVAMQDV